MSRLLLLNIDLWGYQFLAPQWLWLLLIVPVLLFFRYRKFEKKSGVFKFSRPASDLKEIAYSPIKYIIFAIYLLMGAGAVALILAMALPFNPFTNDDQKEYAEGIDIMIAMDVSGSMMATDFLPNRLEAAKEVAKEFIDARSQDRIGFVAFEGEAYTACPATRNYDYLKNAIDQIQSGRIEPGTAIGTGLGTAVARLRSDSLKSKVIILLTDGESNKGEITPSAAAELAKNKDITVYTIGVGKEGFASMPVNTPFGTITQKARVNIDEKLLRKIAETTSGQYFRATDKGSLRDIYRKIDEMEKTKIVESWIKKEPPYRPQSFLIWGIVLLALGLFSEQLLLKKNG